MSHIVRMKTLAQLLKEGWVMDNDQLTKPGKVPVAKSDFVFLGIQMDLVKRPGAIHGWRWVDLLGNAWSKDVIGEVLFDPDVLKGGGAPRSKPLKSCVCDIRQLMDVGCRCGGFAAEQAAKHQGVTQ